MTKEELDALQKNFADERTTIGETLNTLSSNLATEQALRMNLELMINLPMRITMIWNQKM